MNVAIPKILSHIWIGPKEPPYEWMNTWREKHPNWEYRLYDNDFLKSFQFRTKKLIDAYISRQWYAGAADLMRYEILYNYGGFMPEADSICYHNIEELLTYSCAYTVYENELVRGKLVSPILVCEPKNEFVGMLIDELCKLDVSDLDEPWRVTGNLFVAKMIEKHKPNIKIFPSHYFIPIHFEGIVYDGNEKVYAKQLFGSTHGTYNKHIRIPFIRRKINKIMMRRIKKENKKILKFFRNKRLALYNSLDFSENHLK